MELSELLGEAYHEGMSLEEVNTALAGIESPFGERDRYKSALSKVNTEAAGYKKQLKALQSQNESTLTAEQQKYNELSDKYSSIQKELNITKKTKSLMKSGYSEELAMEASTALEENNFDRFMEIQNEFLANRDKQQQATMMLETPRPAVGIGGGQANIVDYDALIAQASNSGQKAYYMRLKQEQAQTHKQK